MGEGLGSVSGPSCFGGVYVGRCMSSEVYVICLSVFWVVLCLCVRYVVFGDLL